MSESARSVLKHLYKEGRMTEAQYQKIDRNLKEPQWIPCSERLPEHGGYFLITNIDELVRLDYFRTSTNDFDNYSAIAWRPLPEPYKEER